MKAFKRFEFTIFIDYETLRGASFGIYFYKWAIEFNIMALWFDIYFTIGKTK